MNKRRLRPHLRGLAGMGSSVGGIPLRKLDGVQKEVLCLPEHGHAVVLGTAGSGKSILAIHRALYLANPLTDHAGRTLLITFNRCLVTYLRHLAGDLPGTIVVENYHKFARGYLNTRGRMRTNCIASSGEVRRLCKQAIENTENRAYSSVYARRPLEFLVEEIRWIARHGIKTASEYLGVRRVGRADTRLRRIERTAVFQLYESYKMLREERGKDYDWEDLSHAVLEEFERDPDQRRYRHIVVDEGQDLSPMELRSLAAAVPTDGSLTFFGDVAQQIYGTKMPWSRTGLRIKGRGVWRFEQNYRNSVQIANLALAVADLPCFDDDPDIVAPKEPIADGPLPILKGFRDEGRELRFVAELARRRSTTATVAVLFRDREQEREFRRVLRGRSTRLHRELTKWPEGPGGLYHGTYHAAKGLEFNTVILPRLSQSRMPHPPDREAFGVERADAMNAKLLYVGTTRAKSMLVLSFSGQVTRLLPSDRSLYQEL